MNGNTTTLPVGGRGRALLRGSRPVGADVTQSVRPAGRPWTLPDGAGAIGSMVLFGLVYAGAAKAGAEWSAVSGVSTVWPAAGVAVAGLLVIGIWAWPAVLVSGYLETITHPIS